MWPVLGPEENILVLVGATFFILILGGGRFLGSVFGLGLGGARYLNI
jgi:hypothetical protein